MAILFASSFFYQLPHLHLTAHMRMIFLSFALCCGTATACTSSFLVGADSYFNKTSYLSGDCVHKPCNLTTAFAIAYQEADSSSISNALACFNLSPGLYQNTYLPPNNTAVHILPISVAPKDSVVFGSGKPSAAVPNNWEWWGQIFIQNGKYKSFACVFL